MKSFISLSIIFLLVLLQQFLPANSEKPLAPALYVFGDSLSDSGNNNFLTTVVKANYKPYGIDFAEGATGRFTNGKTGVDFIAEALGLPYVPPYLGISSSQRSQILTGVNYASGGAGILTKTGSALGKLLYLKKQLAYFQRTVERDLPRHFQSSEALKEYLSKAIFLVSIGGNDYINNYLQPQFYNSSKLYSPQSFAQLLIHKLSKGLQRIYKLGARKMIVSEIGAIGCIPAVVNRVNQSVLCVDQVNQLVSLFNGLLPPLLKQLQSQLPRSIFVHGGGFNISYDMKQNPLSYGFSDATTPCCVVGNIGLCVPDVPPCTNRNQHLYLDSIHPTEAVNSIVAKRCFNGSTSVCSPVNIQRLVFV